MENENRRTGKGIVILIIGLAIAVMAYVGYLAYQDIRDHKEFEKQWELDNKVDIQRINDSAYHVNLGDGSSCFTVEKFGDSLSFSAVNVVMAIIEHDTITVMSSSKSSVWKHVYQFGYYDFFDDTIPEPDKISFNLN